MIWFDNVIVKVTENRKQWEGMTNGEYAIFIPLELLVM